MGRSSSLVLASDPIQTVFNNSLKSVYSSSDLADLIMQHQPAWKLAARVGVPQLVRFLRGRGLQLHELRCEKYDSSLVRYTWGPPQVYELALSINHRGYLSHASAMEVHGLSEVSRSTTYLNIEQSPKPDNVSQLSQEKINAAFLRPQRSSRMIFSSKTASILIVSGKSTNRLGVEEVQRNSGPPLTVSNIERTLIDIVVRPAYAGKLSEILQAYRLARGRFDPASLTRMLQELRYAYPYHQSIGFLMEKAGYLPRDYEPLQDLGIKWNFHLGYRINQPAYSQKWRLFHPSEL